MSVILDISANMLVVARHEGMMRPGHIFMSQSRVSSWDESQSCYRSLWIICPCCGNDSDIGGQFLNFPRFPYISKMWFLEKN